MTKQELARRIAHIEGVKGIDAIVYIEALVSLMDGKNSVLQIGKAFLWDLMIKHDVEVEFDVLVVCCMRGGSILSQSPCEDKSGIPRAILECIAEANPQ